MGILKPKKTTKKGLLVATAIGSAVVGTGVTLLYTTKKGKSIRKDASEKVNSLSTGVTSLLDSAEKSLKQLGREVKHSEKKGSRIVKRAKRSSAMTKKKSV